jgi:predicted dehydrogenase
VIETSWDTTASDFEPVRLGFIGAGDMARFAVYPALHFAPIQLVAVCDLDAEKARQAAAKFGAGHSYTDSGSFCSGSYTGEGNAHRGAPYDNHLQAYLLDFAPHYLDLSREIAGEVRQMAVFHNDLEEGVSFAVALEFESGAVGTLQLNSNRLWWRNYDRIELTGQGEYLVLDSLWKVKHYTGAGNHFTENYRDERSGELTGDAGAWREFTAAIREGREPVCSIHESVKTMELYQALYDAARAGRTGVVFPE